MADKISATYYFFENFVGVMALKSGSHCKLTDAELATIANHGANLV